MCITSGSSNAGNGNKDGEQSILPLPLLEYQCKRWKYLVPFKVPNKLFKTSLPTGEYINNIKIFFSIWKFSQQKRNS